MLFDFANGARYTRPEVFEVVGVPAGTKGGPWFTGYVRHRGCWFIFSTVSTPSRTGHEYGDCWEGDLFRWHGRTRSQLHHPSIRDLLTAAEVYLFVRETDRDPFTFEGLVKPTRTETVVPVKIWWRRR